MSRKKTTIEPGTDTAAETKQEETNETSIEATEEASAEAQPAAPKRRRGRPRKQQQPQVEPTAGLSAMGLSLPATSVAARKAPAVMATPAPQPIPAAPAAHPLDQLSPDQLSTDVNLASASIEKSMDTMVRQWSSVNDISTNICSNLEKVTKLLTEQTQDLEALKAPVAKPSPIARWAIAASAAAVVLSIVSLSLSQSARQEVLSQNAPTAITRKAPAPVALPRGHRTQVATPVAEAKKPEPEPREEKPKSLAAASKPLGPVERPLEKKEKAPQAAPEIARTSSAPHARPKSTSIESELARETRRLKEKTMSQHVTKPAARPKPRVARVRASAEIAFRKAPPRLKPRFVRPLPVDTN